MNYSELLNHKSILDCEKDKDREQHNLDSDIMIDKLDQFADFGAVIKMQQMDPAHKDMKPEYRYAASNPYMYAVNACDVKNGVDFVIQDNTAGIVAYGQNYTISDSTQHMCETFSSFRFLNESAVKDSLDDMSQEQLAELYNNPVYHFDDKAFLQDLREVKRKDLDVRIQMAKDKIEGKEDLKSRDKGLLKDQGSRKQENR